MITKTAERQFRKLLTEAHDNGEPNKHCSCCGGALPPESVYEESRSWDVESGDCDGSVQSSGRCRAFSEIGW
jgi:hypothetical protein